MHNKLKTLTLIIVTTWIVFLIISSTNLMLNKVYADDGEGSTIAGINVSNMKKKEIIDTLKEATAQWKSKPIIISGGGANIEIDSSNINFDIEGTVSEFETLVDKPWFLFWKPDKIVHIPLQVQENEQIKHQIDSISIWNADETYRLFMTAASNLQQNEIEAEVEDLSLLENERLAVTIEEIPNNVTGMNLLVEQLQDQLIGSEKEFSLLENLGTYAENTNNDSLNFVASLLYNTVLQTEFEILERHPQNSIPSYLEAGKEAAINMANNEDLRFLNNSPNGVVLKASIDGNSMKLEMYSSEKTKDVSVRVEKERVLPRIVTRYSRDLAIGEKKVLQNSEEGLRVNVYRTISGEGETREKQISHDYYSPTNRIVLKSTRQYIISSGREDTSNVSAEEPQNDEDIPNLDLDGDGLPDEELDNEQSNNDQSNNEQSSENEPNGDSDLPPGSYYDKGGNLITP